MVQILTIESEYDSAASLGYKTFTYANDVDRRQTIIRWGYGDKGKDFKRVFNPGKCISLNVDKLNASKALSKVVPIPEIYESQIPANIEAVVREHNHSNGEGFQVIKGPYTLPLGYYATKFIKTDVEYRVWFALRKTLFAKRVRSDNKEQHPCRSQWAYSFSKPILELHKLTLLASKKIGLHFGAADVLYKDGKFYFLELNSAPTVDHKKVRTFYQEVINTLN